MIPSCNLFCFDFVSPHAVLSQDQLVSQLISPDRLVCVAMFFHVWFCPGTINRHNLAILPWHEMLSPFVPFPGFPCGVLWSLEFVHHFGWLFSLYIFLCLPFFFSLLFFLAPPSWFVSQQGMKVREKDGAKRTLGKDRKLPVGYPSWVLKKYVPMVSCFLGSLVSIMEASLAVKTGWKYHVLGVGV